MGEYESFAEVYDLFMEEIPYEKWSRYLVKVLKEEGITDGLLLDLGCGTGTMTELLARAGYDMTGVDLSPDMLSEARKKLEQSGLPILYLNQDMREFELYGTMRAIISVCDSMNYLTEPEDLLSTLRLVNNYLDPGGIFLFDLKTEHYYRDILGESVQAATEDEAAYIWENYYDAEEHVNEYQLTIFRKTDHELYERTEEYHAQRAWTLSEVKELAEEAGLLFVGAYEECTKNPVTEDTCRMHVILRENGKNKDE